MKRDEVGEKTAYRGASKFVTFAKYDWNYQVEDRVRGWAYSRNWEKMNEYRLLL
jgi:hypothetical protein